MAFSTGDGFLGTRLYSSALCLHEVCNSLPLLQKEVALMRVRTTLIYGYKDKNLECWIYILIKRQLSLLLQICDCTSFGWLARFLVPGMTPLRAWVLNPARELLVLADICATYVSVVTVPVPFTVLFVSVIVEQDRWPFSSLGSLLSALWHLRAQEP